jgi:HSP20 family molecular chaperone IbpA
LPLAGITAVSAERRKFILVRKQVIRLTYTSARGEQEKTVWIITPNLNGWIEKLASFSGAPALQDGQAHLGGQACEEQPHDERDQPRRSSSRLLGWRPSTQARDTDTMRVREEQVRELAATVAPRGARILWYLWERRHADIEELTRLVGAPPDLDILALLDEEINVNACRLFGRPMLVFKEQAIDPTNGRRVFFRWWLERTDEVADAPPVTLDSASPFVDIHDEGETLLVVIGVPGVKAEAMSAEVRGNKLRLAAETVDGLSEFMVRLPCAVLGVPAKTAFSNTLLSLWLVKKFKEATK